MRLYTCSKVALVFLFWNLKNFLNYLTKFRYKPFVMGPEKKNLNENQTIFDKIIYYIFGYSEEKILRRLFVPSKECTRLWFDLSKSLIMNNINNINLIRSSSRLTNVIAITDSIILL